MPFFVIKHAIMNTYSAADFIFIAAVAYILPIYAHFSLYMEAL